MLAFTRTSERAWNIEGFHRTSKYLRTSELTFQVVHHFIVVRAAATPRHVDAACLSLVGDLLRGILLGTQKLISYGKDARPR